jgi:hypothetical protein
MISSKNEISIRLANIWKLITLQMQLSQILEKLNPIAEVVPYIDNFKF